MLRTSAIASTKKSCSRVTVVSGSQAEMTAIVLAGQRDGEDELAQHAGATCKALVEIGGRPMLSRVLDTLQATPAVAKIVLCGPDEDKLADQRDLRKRIESGDVSWLPPQAGPSASAYSAMCTLPADAQVLLTTADHPLLTVEIVSDFCRRSMATDADVVIGMAPYALVRDEFPTMKKTVLRFSDGELCGCNLFAFLTPKGREAANFWRGLESQRKKPLRILRFLGGLTVAKYLLGTLTIEDALQTFTAKLGIKVRVAILPFGDAAVDVDSVSDYQLVQEKFLRRTAAAAQP